ncbi:tripartite tricarboxylate transporter permease [Oceanibium sediminis]|uniref:tripartite tricarboxylate transporter permease n=1 Tax=Oceanibium sediminis TaxID=2026339 RepID=UPI000DD2BEF8|nr:tripartite tricarboxylate transporter permease [Oceanibium sediminis]
MDLLTGLTLGFQTAITPEALMFCFFGVTVGMFIGVLPGIGPLAAVAMLLPVTYHLEPLSALIMLAGIFYGAQYGGSTASILLNLPGTSTTAVTAIDGYPMARKGRAGAALFITTIASFFGGCFAIVLLMSFAPALGAMALRFSSAEYFSIMILGLVAAATMSLGNPVKGIVSVVAGLMLAMVGMDTTSGQVRYTFGILELQDGLNLVAMAMGLFGVAEILKNAGTPERDSSGVQKVRMRDLMPTRQELRECWKPSIRGAGIGSFIGVLPGAGPTLAAFLAYAMEKRVARDPSRFGKGAVEGISAPEAANNASTQAAFIPTLALGIPGDAAMAVLLGAMMIHGIQPRPEFFTENADLFWGLVVSFWVGNLMLLVLNIPLISVWVRILTIPKRVLFPGVIFFICVGVYSVNNNPFDVLMVIVFGLVGYVMNAFQYPTAPLLMGFILGPMIEQHFRRAILFSRGDYTTFIDRPISAVFLAITALLLVLMAAPAVRSWAGNRSANRGAGAE